TAPITAEQPVTQATPQRNSLPLIIGGVIVLVVLAIAGLVVVPNLNSGPAPVTEIPATIGVPTPFADSQMITTDQYTISIPRQWIPPQGFYDQSDDKVTVHYWQPSEKNSYAAVIIPKNVTLTDATSFKDAVVSYT